MTTSISLLIPSFVLGAIVGSILATRSLRKQIVFISKMWADTVSDWNHTLNALQKLTLDYKSLVSLAQAMEKTLKNRSVVSPYVRKS